MNQYKAFRAPGNYLSILLIILLCLLTRLPQLLSEHMILDSDECIVALMAKHMQQGKAVPVFFYGQSYGFSLAETGMISLFSVPAGITELSVKLAMLALWMAGVLFFYRTLQEVVQKYAWLPLLVTVLFILCPAWAVWSMKARGGYLTAFLCSNVVLWLLLQKTPQKNFLKYALAGLLLVMIYYSQPLWLPGLLPFIVYAFLQEQQRKKWLYFIGGIVPALAVFLLLRHNATDYWKPEVFKIAFPLSQHINHAASLLTDHFNAWYYLDEIYPAPLSCRISGGLQVAAMIVVIAAAVYFAVRNMKDNLLFLFSVAAVLLTLSYSLFLATDAPRYLLPLSGSLFFSLALLLEKTNDRKVLLSVCAPCIVAGAFAMYSFRDYAFDPFTRKQLEACTRYLEHHHVQYVFSNDGLLEWQIMFYSDEHIICRESSKKDRLPQYVAQVNNAYRTQQDHTAVVDFYGDLQDMAPARVVFAGDKFAIVLQPDEQLLRDMEFEF